MILLKIFLILLGILILLLLTLLVPKTWLTLTLHLTDKDKTGIAKIQLAGKLISGLMTIDWPDINARLGICGLYFTVWRKGTKPTAEKKPTQLKRPQKTKAKGVKHTSVEWVAFGKTVIRRFFDIPHIERFNADLTIGLGNPATTGLLMGAYFNLRQTLTVLQSIRVTPDFINKKITGEIEFCGSIRLINIIPLIIFILRFLWSKKK